MVGHSYSLPLRPQTAFCLWTVSCYAAGVVIPQMGCNILSHFSLRFMTLYRQHPIPTSTLYWKLSPTKLSPTFSVKDPED